jgi:hypothetical protein
MLGKNVLAIGITTPPNPKIYIDDDVVIYNISLQNMENKTTSVTIDIKSNSNVTTEIINKKNKYNRIITGDSIYHEDYILERNVSNSNGWLIFAKNT